VAAVEAPAKVNLFLRVLGERSDGYHELETLFQAIDFGDHVRLEPRGRAVELEIVGADLGRVEDNLAYRAAARCLADRDLAARLGATGLHVTLTKRVPAGAGLGGGSSDAAAVLRCFAALTGVPAEDPRLFGIAVDLGSDVPFFLGASPLAVGRGRGEALESRAPLPPGHLVLVSPPVHVSTGWAYRALDDARAAASGAREPRTAASPTSWAEVVAGAHNDFEEVVAAAYPQVGRSLAALADAGAQTALLSGSGSTSFGVFPSAGAASEAARRLVSELGWPCRAVRTLDAFPQPTVS